MKMSGDQSRNVRLVKCPKCWKLLPESPNVPLYMCGGCGAVLQAKVRTNSARDSKIGISGENVVSPAETSSLIQKNETSHDDSGSCTRELPEDRNFQIEVPSSPELTHRSNTPSPETNASVEMPEERKVSNRAPSSVELTQYSSDLSSPVTAASGDENINFSAELLSSAEPVHHSNDPLSPAMDASCKVDGVDERTSISQNGNIDQILITSANSLIHSADTPSRDDVSSSLFLHPAAEPLLNSRQGIARHFDFLKSKLPMEKDVKKSSKNCLLDFGHIQSTDTTEMEEIIDPTLKQNDALRDLPTRSAYIYDGSISSDGTDDQVLYKHKRTYQNDEFIGDAVRADFPMNMSMERQSEIHQDAWSFSSSVDKRYPMCQSSRGSGELVEPIGYSFRDQMRMDEHPSNALSDPMSDRARYENGGPSNKQENPEQERLRLLRMVYDFQDQLHQIQVSLGKSNSRAPSTDSWSANYVPSYVNQAAGKQMDHGSNYSSHLNERDEQWRNWDPYSTSSQMSFLGEASHCGLQVDPSCLRCNAQQVQCSMQLPHPVCCCKESLHRVHLRPGEYFYNTPSCFLPGHRQYMESDVLQNFRDTKSGDQRRAEWYVEYEKPLPSHSVEHPVVKRHFLPIAGAAPFIACYRCQNVLQLPADFLIFRKRFHELRCGACSKILKFSLKNNTHILPYFWYMDDLPSGEFDSGSDAFYRGNYASGNELTSSSSHPDPISCSEDSGLLPRRSLSTEREQLRHLEGDEHNRKIFRSSLQSVEGRKKLISNQSLSATKSLFKSSSHMLNGGQLSSEIEENSATSGSPLHRLMGYSSISQVLRGSGDIEKN